MNTENKNLTNGVTAEESHELLDDTPKKFNKLIVGVMFILTLILILVITCIVVGPPAIGIYLCITHLLLKCGADISVWCKLFIAICSITISAFLVALAFHIYVRNFSGMHYD